MSNIKAICLTPVKNEAWILDRFLKCTSLWADHIIIADQGSTDGSREIALSYPKVTLIENSSSELNESERQNLLLNAARKISGQRLLIALDADEIFTDNILNSDEWNTILSSPPSTVFQFQLINLRPEVKSYWMPDMYFPWGIMDDDNHSHSYKKIHNTRIPISATSNRINLSEIKVLHYQYTDWLRMESKHRWYQCWERINDSKKSAIILFRQYHHMYSTPNELKYLAQEWIAEYQKLGIDMESTHKDDNYWWDEQIVEWITQFGNEFFKRDAIWEICHKNSTIEDPRSLIDKLMHIYLKKSQKYIHHIYGRFFITKFDALLSKLY
jgi:glycosyltransferase involved in cell wall biosynthesis